MPAEKADRTPISRRALIGAATATPALAAGAGEIAPEADTLLGRCGAFVAIDIRISRLLRRWADLEGQAFKIRDWCKLSDEERLAYPQGQEMARIDAVVPDLFAQRDSLMEALPKEPATTPTDVAAKIVAAARMVDPEDNEPLHLLLLGVGRELAGMRCPDCHRPLVQEPWIEWSTRGGRDGKL